MPDLVVTIGAEDAAACAKWYWSFAIAGQNGHADELHGAISLLDSEGAVLAKIELQNVGIFSLEPAKSEANAETQATFAVELYVEKMALEFGGSVGGK